MGGNSLTICTVTMYYESALCPMSCRTIRQMTMMKQKVKFSSEYSLRASPKILSHHPPPPSVLTDEHPPSNFRTFLKWCDSHYYYKYRDTYFNTKSSDV